jgi:hypothetical protein
MLFLLTALETHESSIMSYCTPTYVLVAPQTSSEPDEISSTGIVSTTQDTSTDTSPTSNELQAPPVPAETEGAASQQSTVMSDQTELEVVEPEITSAPEAPSTDSSENASLVYTVEDPVRDLATPPEASPSSLGPADTEMVETPTSSPSNAVPASIASPSIDLPGDHESGVTAEDAPMEDSDTYEPPDVTTQIEVECLNEGVVEPSSLEDTPSAEKDPSRESSVLRISEPSANADDTTNVLSDQKNGVGKSRTDKSQGAVIGIARADQVFQRFLMGKCGLTFR